MNFTFQRVKQEPQNNCLGCPTRGAESGPYQEHFPSTGCRTLAMSDRSVTEFPWNSYCCVSAIMPLSKQESLGGNYSVPLPVSNVGCREQGGSKVSMSKGINIEILEDSRFEICCHD